MAGTPPGRKPNVDPTALRRIVERVVPGTGPPTIRRAGEGTTTQVYRVARDGRTVYLRIAEDAEDHAAAEALAHGLARARGARVPEILHAGEFDPALGRSYLVTAEVPGEPIALARPGLDLAPVLRAAGRDLAWINAVPVAGFGFVRRDRASPTRLEGGVPTNRAFVMDEVPGHLDRLRHELLPPPEVARIERVLADHDPWLDVPAGRLAHGDFDPTHVYHRNGVYKGIIDLGEIRGADPLYDLGHLALHDGERLPFPLLPGVLAGYQEVAPLPPDHERRIAFWGLLIGVRALARSLGRPGAERYRAHLIGAVARLRRQIGG